MHQASLGITETNFRGGLELCCAPLLANNGAFSEDVYHDLLKASSQELQHPAKWATVYICVYVRMIKTKENQCKGPRIRVEKKNETCEKKKWYKDPGRWLTDDGNVRQKREKTAMSSRLLMRQGRLIYSCEKIEYGESHPSARV